MSEIDWGKAPEWADRVVKPCMSTLLYWANNQQLEMVKNRKRSYADDTHIRYNWEVVERRPISNTVSVNVHIAPVKTWHPIEQRIASLRALEKQIEETRAELTRDLQALGLTFNNGRKDGSRRFTHILRHPIPPKKESIITDWRDLRVGDVIAFDGVEGECVVVSFPNLENRPISARKLDAECHLVRPDINVQPFRFIRRP